MQQYVIMYLQMKADDNSAVLFFTPISFDFAKRSIAERDKSKEMNSKILNIVFTKTFEFRGLKK